MLSYDSLINYYKVNFILMHEHKYDLHVLENMLPWERKIYIAQIEQYLKEEKDRKNNA